MAEDSFLLQFLFFLSSLVTALAALPLLAAALPEVLGGMIWFHWDKDRLDDIVMARGVLYNSFILFVPDN